MKRLSITTRITLWYAMFLVAVSVILIIVLIRYYDFREQSAAEEQIVNTIEDFSDRISANGRDFAKDPGISYHSGDIYVSVYDEGGAFFAGAIPGEVDGADAFPEIMVDRTQTFDDDNGRRWYIHDTKIYMESRSNMYIRGIMENTTYRIASGRMGAFFLISIPCLIILAVAGGWLISRQALSPVRELTAVMNEIQADGDLSKRVPVPGSRDETSELTESINGMFDTIEGMVKRERQFTSDVSHELRTPLTIIRSQSEYAMEEPGYAGQALDIINRESHRMSKLITSLLMISRSDSGRLHPDIKAIDIRDMIAEIEEQAKMVASDMDVDIRFIDETGGGELTVSSDEDLLMRIVINLLENAAKYGRDKDGHIELRLRREGRNAVITVADDGEGIAADEQSKVWARFYQTEVSRSRGDSTGLGLAMVDSLTRALGASVRIVPDEEKRPGELPGAVFELTLPIDDSKKHSNT